MSNKNPIGFFDSGVGGLTIWNEVTKVLPFENTLYIADSANAPYGTKTKQEIISLSIANSKKLIELGAKLIVVACNTATTQAIHTLRQSFDVPFIGIEPATKPAALASVTKTIAVLATNGTLESEHFNKTKELFTPDVKLITRVGEGLVTEIENGNLHTPEMKVLLEGHLKYLVNDRTDYLVLGCTHYPLLRKTIQEIIGDRITIVDSGKAVAEQVRRVLVENQLLNIDGGTPIHKLFSTKNLKVLKSITKELDSPAVKEIIYSDSLYQSE